MDFDWNETAFNVEEPLTTRDIEESFEDPFALRLMPDSARFANQSRYFNLGRSIGGQGVFSYFRTNGKTVRVIFSRPFVKDEQYLYLRKFNESLSQ